MEQRISLITLGVHDLDRAVKFYELMGFKRHMAITEGVAFFQMNGIILSLFPRDDLAKDAGVSFGKGLSAIAIAYNTRSEAEVDEVISLVQKAGGAIVKAPEKAFWGGRSAYFADTENNLWEVAYNRAFPIDEDGITSLPDSP